MGALLALDWFLFLYTDESCEGCFLGTPQDWAPLAAMFGGAIGLVAGFVLGFLLSLNPRAPGVGALFGALEGLAIIVVLLAPNGFGGDTRADLMLATFVPIGAITGWLTSLIISAIASSAKPGEHTYTVLGLQQNKTDESR